MAILRFAVEVAAVIQAEIDRHAAEQNTAYSAQGVSAFVAVLYPADAYWWSTGAPCR